MQDHNKKIYFISGLPRSGSTLLCNVLAQNPDFYVTPTSGLIKILLAIRERWNQIGELKASNDLDCIRVLRGMFYGFFSDVDKKICIDKSRGWCRHIEMAEEILQQKVKILVCVRDLKEVLASFEKIWRKNAGHRAIPQEINNYEKFQTIEGRLATFMADTGVVGGSYNAIRDAVHRGYGDQMFFIDFDAFTTNPEQTVSKIYSFLDLPYFAHNFKNVEQVVTENDEYHGFDDLHTIRQEITSVLPKWRELIGEDAVQPYLHLNFWKNSDIGLNTNL